MTGDVWFPVPPSGWDVERLKFAVTLVDQKSDAGTGSGPYIGLENVESWTGRRRAGAATITALGMVNVYTGNDVLFAKLRPYLAKALEPMGEGLCSTEFLVMRPRKLTRRYLLYVLLSKAFIDVVNAWTYGVKMPRASWDIVGNLLLPIPSIEEQEMITAVLDREIAEADALVVKYERLIELLEEKRLALIMHMVTKGLDPGAPMISSGVDWIGEIPKDWSVERIKWLARLESGHTPDKKVSSYWENGTIPWVSLNDTGLLRKNDYINETTYYTTEEGIANSSAHLLPTDTVVFSRDATIGRCAITSRPMAVSQHFIAWVCGELVLPQYLLRVLRAMTQELERLTFGATIKTIGMPDVKTLRMPLPPIGEQQAICAAMNESLTSIDVLLSKAQAAIGLLHERRNALITAAVTGQLDTRNYSEVHAPIEALV